MTLETLKASILTVLDGIIGTYKLPGGTVVPAISVQGRGDYPPPGTIVTGLEVVISPEFEVGLIPQSGSVLSSRVDRRYQIDLKQWSDTGTTIPAKDALIDALDRLEVGARVIPNSDLDNIESQRLVYSEMEMRR